jgi:hypothetical protein
MVAFSSADVAVEWCLMVQQVLRDMSWPVRYDIAEIEHEQAACWCCKRLLYGMELQIVVARGGGGSWCSRCR